MSSLAVFFFLQFWPQQICSLCEIRESSNPTSARVSVKIRILVRIPNPPTYAVQTYEQLNGDRRWEEKLSHCKRLLRMCRTIQPFCSFYSGSLNLFLTQHKLHDIFIFGMAYCSTIKPKALYNILNWQIF